MLARWPGHIKPGSHSSSLVSSIDVAPTFLKLAGLKPGPTFQGFDFSPLFHDPDAKVRDMVFAERNWHDYAARARSVRSDRYQYIHNDHPELTLSPPADAVRSPTFQTMRQLRDQGKLSAPQLACFVTPRASEELYDLKADPNQFHNLAGDPKYSAVLDQMRQALSSWTQETADVAPEKITPDEFDRETGKPLPNRVRPRPGKTKPKKSS
jgi:arylsulfatase A-like enzyme